MKPVFILAAILIFGVLIAVHELGHFVAAKLCGVRVNEFSIGMGPLIWQKEKGETQYSLRALPIGGYCAMEGEDEDTGDERSFVRQGFWKKLKGYAAKAGVSLVYKALQLYYVAQSPNCPKRVKMGIYSALGYFILPVDAIPDFIPLTGYTDDLAAIAMALLLAQVYITDDIRARARAKVVDFFGEEQVAKGGF